MLVPCYLGPSGIEGLGVFCSEPIKKGQPIWTLDLRLDRLLSISEFEDMDSRIQNFLLRYTYIRPHDRDHYVLDGDEGRYMNHSDAPNTDYPNTQTGYAVCDIPAHTELTCDYRQFDINAHEFMASIGPIGAQLTENIGIDMSAARTNGTVAL